MTNIKFERANQGLERTLQDAPAVRLSSELSEGAFVAKAYAVMEMGYRRGHSLDYVTGNVRRLIVENPKLAKEKGLVSDYPTIKQEIVKPVYRAFDEEAGKKKGKAFDLSKTSDCLLNNFDKMKVPALTCAATFLPEPVTLPVRVTAGVLGCGAVAVTVAACIQDGLE